MRIRLAVLVVAGTLMSPSASFAQAPNTGQPPSSSSPYLDPVSGLTLEDAIARALEHEPSLQAMRTDIEVARGDRLQAGLRPNPSISMTQQKEPVGTDSQTQIGVQWPLELFRRAGRVQVAERDIVVRRAAITQRERLLAWDVREEYGAALVAIRRLSVTDDLIRTTARQHVLVSARVEAGSAPPLERDMLRVEVQRLAANRLLRTGEVDRALIRLKRLLGVPPSAALTLRDPLESVVHHQSVEQTAAEANDATAAGQRPDVVEAAARADMSAAQINRARRDGRFDVSLFGTYMRTDAGFPQRAFDEAGNLARVHGDFNYVSAGVMVTVPLQNRNQGAIAAARAARAGAAGQVEATRMTAASEIAAARTRDEHARQALAIFDNDAIALAAQNLEIVRQTYELGRGTLSDVLNEQRRYLDLQRDYTDTLGEAFDARQALAQALGETR